MTSSLKDIGDQTHLSMGNKAFTVGGDDTTRFLAAVLQRIKPEVDQIGRLGMAIDSHHRAFFVKFVEHFQSQHPI